MSDGAILGGMAVLQTLAVFVLKAILESTIKFEFRKREQAALVASLFAEWIDDPANRKELNRLAWEATLWLPDKLAVEINRRLNNAPNARDLKEILVDVKGLIHGQKSSLNPMDLVHYPKR